ncbi:MAG: hypothetical protein JSU86_12920 [Phycisphaerales bacterium]|nr:MAG: hypothetical protein JSU86_12920 [Phycisphaerales bacterium]
MNDLTHVPYARPAGTMVTGISTQHTPVLAASVNPAGNVQVHKRTDGFAVASAICGFTAIVPLVSQVIGLAFGTLSLARIRRARRAGIELGGAKWALTGIVSSAFTLICWVGIFVAISLIGSSLSHSVESLNTLMPPTP